LSYLRSGLRTEEQKHVSNLNISKQKEVQVHLESVLMHLRLPPQSYPALSNIQLKTIQMGWLETTEITTKMKHAVS